MHEIVTIQLGSRANHVATHFWNTQESYFTYDSTQALSPVDHDVHFRPGLGARGEETYTPRTLIYDLKGGFGGLRKWEGLYDQQVSGDGGAEQGKGVWDGNVVLHQDPEIEQSDFQRSLDDGSLNAHNKNSKTIRYWSDFNRVFYHPRSIVQLSDYELDSFMPFEKWENGEHLFSNVDKNVDLLDRDVRVWAEECDQIQAIQVLTGGDDAWSAFAARYVEVLRDEFGKTGIWTWGFEEEQGKGQKDNQLLRIINTARMIDEMSTHASMYIPMSLPPTRLPQHLNFDRDSQWHTSALFSTALESTTLPTRLRFNRQKRGFFDDLEGALNVNGDQRIAQLQCSVLDSEDVPLVTTTTHGENDDRAPPGNSCTLEEEDGLKRAKPSLDMNLSYFDPGVTFQSTHRRRTSDHVFGAVETKRTARIEAYKKQEPDEDEIIEASRRPRFAGLSVIERYHSSLAYPLLDSFPPIISPLLGHTHVAVHTLLSTTSGTSKRIKALQCTVSKMGKLEERETLSNRLGEIGDAYEDGWHSGSDESDD